MDAWLWGMPLWTCGVAAAWDARTGLIPNWLTLPALASALIFAGLRGGAEGLVAALVAVALVSVPNVWLFARGVLGGGDVKLFAALAAFLGCSLGVQMELLSLTLITAWTLVVAAWSGQLWVLLRASVAATLHLMWPRGFPRPAPIPGGLAQVRMGPFIALATLLVAWEGMR